MSTKAIEQVYPKHYLNKITDVDAETLILDVGHKCNLHQVSVEDNTGSPAAGTLTISGRPKGISTFQAISGGVISLASPTPVVFNGLYEQIKITPASIDSGYTYDLISTGQ